MILKLTNSDWDYDWDYNWDYDSDYDSDYDYNSDYDYKQHWRYNAALQWDWLFVSFLTNLKTWMGENLHVTFRFRDR